MEIHEISPERKSLPTRGIKCSPEVWIEQKKVRDTQLWGNDSSKFWIIDNKLYDLTPFLDDHPGGKSWLTMTQGHDVTDFFIIHHLNQQKARVALQKYYVGQTANKLARFTFEQDGLYRTVKRKVLKEMSVFEIQNQSASKKHACLILALFFFFLLLTASSIDLQTGSLVPYLFATCCSITLVGILGIGHNFVHHRDNVFKYFLLLTGFTHTQWEIVHCLSHHVYTNTELDFDLGYFEPIMYFLRNQPANKKYTQLLLSIAFILNLPLNILIKLIVQPILQRKRPDILYTVPLLGFALFYITCGDLWYSFKLYFYIYGLLGYLYNRILGCGHLESELWTEGAERIDDFGEHTVLTTSDTDAWLHGFGSYLFMGGFNMHTAHHFFPTADHAALPRILQIIVETCKEMSIKHISNTRSTCFKSISKGIVKREPFSRH